MCLIVVKPKGTALPKEEYLLHSAKRNSDGQGLAYLSKRGGSIKLKKDFPTAQALVDYMNQNITVDDELIIHFRFATHGLKDEGNRHPFPLSKNKALLRKTELECKFCCAHNGVLSQYSRTDDEQLSDSQRFIVDILSDSVIKENFNKPSVQKLINEFLSNDRLVTMTSKDGMLLFGDWEVEDGISYSNSGYKPIVVDRSPYGYGCATGFYDHWGSYHAQRQGGHHQSNLLNDKRKTGATKEQKKNDFSQEDSINMTTECEGCDKRKKVKLCTYKGDTYLLCKKCRRKARKNCLKVKVNVQSQREDKVKEFINTKNVPMLVEDGIEKFECTSCREDFKYDELHLVYGSYLLCTNCKKKMQEDEKQGVLFAEDKK